MLNAFTIDVEDYFHVSAFAKRIRTEDWGDYASRVVGNTEVLLRLLDRHDVRATCFVLGWVADREPDLIRRIRDAGHEIGCHSYWHQLIYDQSPETFREDLRRANQAIESCTGEPVTLYRAPSFSIVEDSRWALEILADEGIAVDSSIYPIRHDRYGIPGSPTAPYAIETPTGTLWEYPGTAVRVWGPTLPVGGGGYFRIYPWSVTRKLLNRVNKKHNRPFMFYVHPWEVDPDQPHIPTGRTTRFRHYHGLAKTMDRMDTMLRTFSFSTLTESLNAFRHAERHPQLAKNLS